MHRRTLLRIGVVGAAATPLAGCLDDLFGETNRVPDRLSDPPDAVYLPTHVDDHTSPIVTETGPYGVAVMYTYPHYFWLVTGRDTRFVEIKSDHDIHLMATVWDAATGTVLPTGSLDVSIARDGETVAERSLWPMVSQRMGPHFGDNLTLDGDGTYEATITVGHPDSRLAGDLADRPGDSTSVTVDLEYAASTVDDLEFDVFDDPGQPGAAEAMAMPMLPELSAPEALSGDTLGEARLDDAAAEVVGLDEPPPGVEGTGPYLAVVLTTPYNRFPLPMASMTATVRREDDTVFDGPLVETLSPELGSHYGAIVDDLDGGDAVDVVVEAPPQIARHEGYETAFLEMDGFTVTV
ncbi:MAG: iron transporter [Halobacteriales archaeon]